MIENQGCQLSALGIVNAMGSGTSQIYKNLIEGNNYFLTEWNDLLVGKVSENLPKVPDHLIKFNSRNFQIALAAAKQIEPYVENTIRHYGSDRIAVVIGSSTSGIAVGEQAVRHFYAHDSFPEDYDYSQQELGSVADGIRDYFGINGVSYTVSTACSSSAKVFSSAIDLIKLNLSDAVVVGGVDSLCEMTLRGFSSLELTSTGISQAFSKNRDGINIGEGAAFFLLTKEPGGIRLLGVGESSDAYHMSAPHPEGAGAEQAMLAALSEACVHPGQLSYINLHGTGTKHNDSAEGKAINRVFGNDGPACSSTKSFFGHTLGACGAMELGVCWLLLNHATTQMQLPPHLYDNCKDLEIPKVTLTSKSHTVSAADNFYCLSNSFAFGGSNCAVVLGRGVGCE